MAVDVRPGRVSAGARRSPRARYLPIAEHGLIGDLHTVARVGTDGTIDWYCCPRFDSPSVFAAILDAEHAGLFRISPDCDGWSSKQLYLPDTTVLITRFLMPDGAGEMQDFMPPVRTGEAAHRHRMIRRVLAVRGQMRFVVDAAPRFDYARAGHEVALTPRGALFRSPALGLALSTRCPLEIDDGGDVRARIEPRGVSEPGGAGLLPKGWPGAEAIELELVRGGAIRTPKRRNTAHDSLTPGTQINAQARMASGIEEPGALLGNTPGRTVRLPRPASLYCQARARAATSRA